MRLICVVVLFNCLCELAHKIVVGMLEIVVEFDVGKLLVVDILVT